VVGGVVPKGDDYACQAIDARTGRGGDGGDILPEDSLASAGKTLGAALGIPLDTVEKTVVNPSSQETVGKVIKAALRS
jgi:hypothetical protein